VVNFILQNQKRVLSIKELNKYIKMKLESDSLLQDVWIRGEISNFTHHSSGHMYFTLKDKESRLKCIMFASQNQRLAFIPREGTMVLAGGNVSVYERDGQYQFYVNQMQPDGIGSLFLAYEQLKKKLESEGLFSPDIKKEIPKLPQAVGVITSPTGAAVRDILITLQRRYPAVPILLFPVSVQGKQAAPSIVRALEVMNQMKEVDVIIVGRGGGSLEELWAFNEESVARSIHASQIPVISAVGHETDFTIADFVADLRAATPTAAAELAVPHHLELKQRMYYYKQQLYQGLLKQLQRKQEKLARLQRSSPMMYPRRHLLEPAQRLDRLKEQLVYKVKFRISQTKEKNIKLERALSAFNPQEQIRFAGKRVTSLKHQLVHSMQAVVKGNNRQLISGIRHLDALSPLKVMQRGYSLVYDEKQNKLVKSISQIQLGDIVKIRLTDGQADCQVWSMKGEGNDEGNEA
jgi:exodeoxyribonuclease VII large subunit